MSVNVVPVETPEIHALLKAQERIAELEAQVDRWVTVSEGWDRTFYRLEKERDEARDALERYRSAPLSQMAVHPGMLAGLGMLNAHPAQQANAAALQATYGQAQNAQNAFANPYPADFIPCNCTPARADVLRVQPPLKLLARVALFFVDVGYEFGRRVRFALWGS